MSSGNHRPVCVRAVLAAAWLVSALSVTGCSSGEHASTTMSASAVTGFSTPSTPQGSSTVVVRADQRTFAPAAVTIKVGDTVTWTFSDQVPHAVQGIGDAAMSINSPIRNQGEWSHTFTIAGDYRYLCPVYPEMRGTVTVE